MPCYPRAPMFSDEPAAGARVAWWIEVGVTWRFTSLRTKVA